MSLVAFTPNGLAVLNGWQGFSADSACSKFIESWPKALKTERNGWRAGHGVLPHPKRFLAIVEQRTLAHAAK